MMFAVAFLLAAAGGFAWFLRGQKSMEVRAVVSALLNSGLLGLATAMIWFGWSTTGNDVWLILGTVTLSSLGGLSMVRFALGLLKAWAESHSKQQRRDER